MRFGVPATGVNRSDTVLAYWRARLAQHTQDTYRGRTLAKFPEDLRTYQHIIERSRPDLIIEMGTYDGGSAVWFADQLDVLAGGGRVITVDITAPRQINDERIEVITGALADEVVIRHIREFAIGRRVMVIDDSAHTLLSTSEALANYASLVSHGCWFVVEDGVVDELDLSIWPNVSGVQPAIDEFLLTEQGSRFERHDLALYGLTTCHNGWLEARGDP